MISESGFLFFRFQLPLLQLRATRAPCPGACRFETFDRAPEGARPRRISLEPGRQATREKGTKIFHEPLSEIPKPSHQGPVATDFLAPSQGRTPHRRHVSGKKSQERQRAAGARRWLEPGHPIRSVPMGGGRLSRMNPVKKQGFGNIAKTALQDQFGQERVIRVRVRTNRRGLPDNRRPGDSVDLFTAVPSVDQRAMSHMRLRITYDPRTLDA